MSRETPIPDEIRPLMGIRGVFCVPVVVFHLHPVLFLLVPSTGGWFNELAAAMLAVDFFFMLSGFVIAHNYLDDLAVPDRRRLAHYWVLRVARIWPLHVVMVLAFLAYHLASVRLLGYGLEGDVSAPNVAANLVMLHEFAPFSAVNPPSWSMAPELGAYAAFPLLAVLLVRLRRPAVVAALLVVLLGAAVVVLSAWYDDLGPDDWSHRVAWLRVGFSFPAGCLAAVLWRLLPPGWRRHRAWDPVAVLALTAAVALALGLNRGVQMHEPVEVYPLLLLVVLASAGAAGPVAAALSAPLVHGAGRLSFAVYLTHFLVLVASYALLVRAGAGEWDTPARLVALLAVALGVVAAGWLAHVLVEEPARRAIRRLAPRPRMAVAAGRADSLLP